MQVGLTADRLALRLASNRPCMTLVYMYYSSILARYKCKGSKNGFHAHACYNSTSTTITLSLGPLLISQVLMSQLGFCSAVEVQLHKPRHGTVKVVS